MVNSWQMIYFKIVLFMSGKTWICKTLQEPDFFLHGLQILQELQSLIISRVKFLK